MVKIAKISASQKFPAIRYTPCLMQIWNQLSWHFVTESGKIHVVRSGVRKKIEEWAQSGQEGLPPAHRRGSYKKFITY